MIIATQTAHACGVLGMEEGIRLLCESGYEALDLSLFRMTADDCPFNGDDYRALTKSLRDLAQSYGVRFTQAHAPFSFNFADPEIDANIAQPRIRRSIEIAALTGAHTIIIHPIHYQLYHGHEAEMHALNVEYYASFIPLCRELGIKVAVENMWQRDPVRKYIVDDVASRGAELASYIDELNALCPAGEPCFTACLDLGHSGLVGEEAQDAIRIIGGERLGALHIHDNNYIADQHTIPGLGKMNFVAITDALREVGYRGEFTYEADAFLRGFPKDLLPVAVKFMVDIARYWAARCE